MAFLIAGLLLLALKLTGIEPVASWNWLVILAPFALAVAWWAYADASGLTRRRALQRMEDRQKARRQKAVDALRQPVSRADGSPASRSGGRGPDSRQDRSNGDGWRDTPR